MVETPSDKIKILVVDDSDVILHALNNFFQKYNIDVVTCHDGLEGIQKAIETKPGLIILDLLMPNLDGVKMLRVIKVMNDIKDIPVIVISGNTNRRNVMAAIEAGAEKVLSKPLKKELLKKSISEVLGPEVFEKAKKNTSKDYSYEDDTEFINELRKYFLNSFSTKAELVNEGIKSKKLQNIRAVFHDLKGSGSTIKFPELSEIGMEVQQKADENFTDWDYYQKKWDRVLEIVDKIKAQQVGVE